MNRRVSLVLAALVGVGIGAGVFVWLVPNVVFAAVVALSWALGVVFSFRHGTLMFGSPKTRGRTASLWSGAFTGFLTFVALIGIMALPFSDDLGLAVSLLVLGVGFAALGFGIGMTHAYRDQAADADTDRGVTELS